MAATADCTLTAAIAVVAALVIIGGATILVLLAMLFLATHTEVSAALTNVTEGITRVSAAQAALAAQMVVALGFRFANTGAAADEATISTTGAMSDAALPTSFSNSSPAE